MSRSTDKVSVPAAIAVGAVAVIALIASGVLRPTPATGATPSQSPSAPASPAPATPAPATPVPATPVPATPVPGTPEPTDGGLQPVRLDIATPNDVVLEVWDHAGVIDGARSGRAGDGMSVRWSDMQIENLGPSTLRLTWVGFAADDDLILAVNEHDGVIWLTLAQPGPPPNSDALGFDRVLILEFASPINADDVHSVIQEGVDTAG